MQRLAGRRIFSIGDRVVLWEDVVLAAHVWGAFATLEARVAEALSAERRLEAGGRAPSDAEIEDAGERWRYAHDLISGDDLDAWLTARSLSVDEWFGWVRRRVAVERSGAVGKTRAAARDVRPLLLVEAMCSGLVDELTGRYAGRAAVLDRTIAEGPPRPPPASRVEAALARLPTAVRTRGLWTMRSKACVDAVASIVRMGAAYDRLVKQATDAATLGREVASRALDWTRFDTQSLVFTSEGAAREAALLVREDGLPFSEVAAAAGSEIVRSRHVLSDVDDELRSALTGARPGELIGPVRTTDGFIVSLITDRVPPSVDDRDIRARARDLVERRVVGAEIDKRVVWHERF